MNPSYELYIDRTSTTIYPVVKTRKEFLYDGNGNVKEIVSYESESKISGNLVYKYDNKTNFLKFIGFPFNMNVKMMTFDTPSNNNFTEVTGKFGNDNLNYKAEYEYDNEGKVIKINEYYNNKLTETLRFEYEKL